MRRGLARTIRLANTCDVEDEGKHFDVASISLRRRLRQWPTPSWPLPAAPKRTQLWPYLFRQPVEHVAAAEERARKLFHNLPSQVERQLREMSGVVDV